MVDPSGMLPITRQCELLGIPRSNYYYSPASESSENLKLMRIMDEEHTKHPFHGVKGMTNFLNINRKNMLNIKRIRRLMRLMGLEAIYPKPRLSIPGPGHMIMPYLLRDIVIDHPNHVWSTDITYIPMYKGFMYLVAVIDWCSRRVLSWELSNTLSTQFCVDALDMAFNKFGVPEIFNTDQGSQFTSAMFQERLTANGVRPSMDGRRRALDNVFIERLWRSVKYEDIYINCYGNGIELFNGLKVYFDYYNYDRPHQGMDGKIPDEVYYGIH